MTESTNINRKIKFASAIVTDRVYPGRDEGDRSSARDMSWIAHALVQQVRSTLQGDIDRVGDKVGDHAHDTLAVDLLIVFVSASLSLDAPAIVTQLRAELKPKVLLGCSAEGVITNEQEIEDQPSVAIIAARLPGTTIKPFSLNNTMDDWERSLSSDAAFCEMVGAPVGTTPPKLFILLADPFSTPIEPILESFNNNFPGVPLVGGLASGANFAGASALLMNDTVQHFGAVGLALSGAIDVDVIVSQGCRPIGHPYKITRANENMIFGLNGGAPVKLIQAMLSELPRQDQALLRNGLYIGHAIRTPSTDIEDDVLGRGDFLIRGVLDSDATTGAIVVGDRLNDGEMVQFHLRDADTAEEDLALMLAPQALYEPPAGALLFSCNGRGTRLYDHANGDIAIIQHALGQPHRPIELAGFFCAGEIGPIGGRNFLHGHTASLVLFRAAQSATQNPFDSRDQQGADPA